MLDLLQLIHTSGSSALPFHLSPESVEDASDGRRVEERHRRLDDGVEKAFVQEARRRHRSDRDKDHLRQDTQR